MWVVGGDFGVVAGGGVLMRCPYGGGVEVEVSEV
jgi:hypothetical protein